MGDVLTFPEPEEPLVWQCACGSIRFELYDDGLVFCTECGLRSDTIRCFEV